MQKRGIGEKIFDVFNVLFMLLLAVITIYPLYYVLVSSFSESAMLMGQRGLLLWPKGFNLDGYLAVFANPNIWSGYRTTLFVVIAGTVLNIGMTALGAFLLTRKNFAIKSILGYMIIFTMYFSGGMIPTYLVVYRWLHLGNTLWALLLPGAISTYNLIIMRSNFAAIPESLEESAKIDGANDIIVLVRIILPLSLPILAVMVLFYGSGHWNSWFGAMLYIRKRELYPLQLILREILLNSTASSMAGDGDTHLLGLSIKYATIMVATVPILCVYPFVQKYFVQGIMVGAVKG